jgi:hypothetical protein
VDKTIEDVMHFYPTIVQGYQEDSLFQILVQHYMSIENIEEAAAKRLARAYINLLLKYLEDTDDNG